MTADRLHPYQREFLERLKAEYGTINAQKSDASDRVLVRNDDEYPDSFDRQFLRDCEARDAQAEAIRSRFIRVRLARAAIAIGIAARAKVRRLKRWWNRGRR